MAKAARLQATYRCASRLHKGLPGDTLTRVTASRTSNLTGSCPARRDASQGGGQTAANSFIFWNKTGKLFHFVFSGLHGGNCLLNCLRRMYQFGINVSTGFPTADDSKWQLLLNFFR